MRKDLDDFENHCVWLTEFLLQLSNSTKLTDTVFGTLFCKINTKLISDKQKESITIALNTNFISISSAKYCISFRIL